MDTLLMNSNNANNALKDVEVAIRNLRLAYHAMVIT